MGFLGKHQGPIVKPTPPAAVGDIRIHCSTQGEVTELPRLVVEDSTVSATGVPDPALPNRYTFTLPGDTPRHGWRVYTSAESFVRPGTVVPGPGDHEGPRLVYAPPKPVYGRREGVVRLEGKAWVDGRGPFYPLYTSLFWALRGWMNGEQERVRKNLAFVADHGFDGVRVFYHVDWPDGLSVLGTPQALGELLDCAYDEFGLRLKITVQAGAKDAKKCAREVAQAVKGREHKVLLIEGTNERWASREDAIAIVQVLKATGLPVAIGFGDAGVPQVMEMGDASGATVDVIHTERGGDEARLQRQCWDFHLLKRAGDCGEPIGPASSVASTTDPFLLATQRAGAIICGGGAYCFHTGSGIYGVPRDTQHGRRYANLWEIPNIDAMMRSVRNVDGAIGYMGVENWHHYHGTDDVKPSGHFEKQYGAKAGNEFVHILTDTKGSLSFTPKAPANFQCYDPSTGQAVDPAWANLRAYVLRGAFK